MGTKKMRSVRVLISLFIFTLWVSSLPVVTGTQIALTEYADEYGESDKNPAPHWVPVNMPNEDEEEEDPVYA